VGRKNHRPNRPQNQRSTRIELGLPPRATIPPTPVDQVVIPDGRCFLNPAKPKAFYNTESKAAKALKQAQRKRLKTGSAHVEKRFYRCTYWLVDGINYRFLNHEDALQRAAERGITTPLEKVEHWHLTSRESYDPKAWRGGAA